MRTTITEGLTRIERAFRDLEAVAAPPADARDLRKELAAFASTVNELAQDVMVWSSDIRTALARKDDALLEKVLRGEEIRERAAVDDDGV